MTAKGRVPLRTLEPGTMFKRHPNGQYRYVVSLGREFAPDKKTVLKIWCFNLDGDSDGYYHDANEPVIAMGFKAEPTEPEPLFWMCFAEGGYTPAMRHFDMKEAKSEAERLAHKLCKRVWLLEADSYVEFIPPKPTGFRWTDL